MKNESISTQNLNQALALVFTKLQTDGSNLPKVTFEGNGKTLPAELQPSARFAEPTEPNTEVAGKNSLVVINEKFFNEGLSTNEERAAFLARSIFMPQVDMVAPETKMGPTVPTLGLGAFFFMMNPVLTPIGLIAGYSVVSIYNKLMAQAVEGYDNEILTQVAISEQATVEVVGRDVAISSLKKEFAERGEYYVNQYNLANSEAPGMHARTEIIKNAAAAHGKQFSFAL